MHKHRLYLDNAATTQPSDEVIKAMVPFLKTNFGNPSSLHDFGSTAKQAIEKARTDIAAKLNCAKQEIIFTSGGTESINLAIFGVARQYQLDHGKAGHIIVSAIEHEAVLESAKALQEEGWEVSMLPVDKQGIADLSRLEKLIKKDTVLVSVMYANNETGAIQPIQELASKLAKINKQRNSQKLNPIIFHTDACQAGGSLILDLQKLKVDLLTLNSSKLQGPKGSGLLYKRHGIKLRPLIFGGGQEFGLRSGTENTAAIIGLAKAIELNSDNPFKRVKKLFNLQHHLETQLSKQIEDVNINGPMNLQPNAEQLNFGLRKLPSTTNVTITGVEAEAVLYYMDAKGFAIATGSACTSQSTNPSHVLIAMGLKPDDAYSSLRISLSEQITKSDITKFVKALAATVKMLQQTEQNVYR